MPTHMPVEIKSLNEPWAKVELADGSVITIRLIIMGVEAVYDDNGNHTLTPDGQLAYVVAHSVVFKTTSSSHLLTQRQPSIGRSN